MSRIQLKDFSVFYKLKKKEYAVALDKINLTVSDGEFLVVVGPSGCGKTTLIKSILGLCQLTDGEIEIDGISLNKTDKKQKNIGYVSQEYSLYPQMTVYENIAFPLRMMHTAQKEVDIRVRAIAQRLQIEWLLTRKPNQLSGGQHQRIAIARALIKNPRLVLFDEPFSNLDPALRLEMRELVKELHDEQRPTYIFVTHDLSEAMYLAERIVVMARGEIVEEGTPKEIEKQSKTKFVKDFFAK